MDLNKKNKNYCYILRNNNRTYIGYTLDPHRRIRQHNGEISGGARSTKGKFWEFLAIITSNDEKFTKKLALSIEWNLKNPLGKNKRDKKFMGVDGKINTLNTVLNRYTIAFDIYILEDYKERLKELKNSNVNSLSDFKDSV